MYNKLTKVAPVLISRGQLIPALVELPNWKLVNNELTRDISFKDFETTWAFLTQVSMRAHLWGHHPTITTCYNRVRLQLSTHDLGNKISDIDLKMAKRYENYVKMYEKTD